MGTDLPHAAVTGCAVIAACAGFLSLLDGTPEGHSFSSLSLDARGRWECYMVNMGSIAAVYALNLNLSVNQKGLKGSVQVMQHKLTVETQMLI